MTLSTLTPALQQLLDSVPEDGTTVSGETVRFAGEDTALEGYLARPAGDDDAPKPAVLIVHDWLGVTDHVRVRAEMMARLGYVTLAADVFGAGVRPSGPEEAAALAGQYYGDIPLFRSRLLANLERLRSEPGVDASRVGVMGYCFGGSGALEIARAGEEVAAVVAFHGGLGTSAPSTENGVHAAVLVLTGAEDPVVPPAAVQGFEDEMRAARVQDWQVVTYSGAMHAFAVPDTDAPAMGAQFQESANHRSWTAMQNFFSETLA
ncbi:dienelactone hydrolase family protein [Nakamurella sp. PAMC28650]|uniref:dienelactone hydrolase family protein n=1 Tax=Nakamurella sp. PAMC28650 TaxID=2762325 RepID=UPI00164D1673|nr:dienelactone hydrolase family protein [Nakamurella sp. PAMC28650]QNK79610.1 dienelactone hydrolase family protein [Nakamurella sp. PAMC28650]